MCKHKYAHKNKPTNEIRSGCSREPLGTKCGGTGDEVHDYASRQISVALQSRNATGALGGANGAVGVLPPTTDAF